MFYRVVGPSRNLPDSDISTIGDVNTALFQYIDEHLVNFSILNEEMNQLYIKAII